MSTPLCSADAISRSALLVQLGKCWAMLVLFCIPPFLFADESGPTREEKPESLIQKHFRGLIQNELEVINSLVDLSKEQRQKLLDKAEQNWFTVSSREIARKLQPHVHGTIDLDGLVERTVAIWVRECLSTEHVVAYENELNDRLQLRKAALVEETSVWLQNKLQLSSSQVIQVQKILEEKWKDRWYRSIEGTFENESLLPEISRSSLDGVISKAQVNALSIRSPLGRPAIWNPQYPSLELTQRFHIGETLSATSIPLGLGLIGGDKVEEVKQP